MTEIRNPLNYLMETHGVPLSVAQPLLLNSALWEEDRTGVYVNKNTLDVIGRSYYNKQSRKEMKQLAKENKKLRKFKEKRMKEIYAQINLLPEDRYNLILKMEKKDEKIREALK